MKAILPVNMDVRVKVFSNGGLLDYDYNMPNTGWAMQNWDHDFINTREGEIDSRLFLGWFEWDLDPGDSTDMPTGPYTVDLEIFENGDLEPTWTHTLTVNDGTPPEMK